MIDFPVTDRERQTVAHARRKRAFGTALAELALTVCLILSIAVILVATGASGALANTRTDIIMMEESTGSAFTTLGIVSIIVVVMGVLTILALRDVAPVHSKRAQRRSTTTTTVPRR